MRNLKRNKTISAINILGLTFGLAITSLIVLYVVNELTYDSFHKNSEDIYRIYREKKAGSYTMSGSSVNAPLGPYIVEHYPKVISQVRISGKKDIKLDIRDNKFDEKYIYADASFFQIFTFKFIYGDENSALIEPFSLVLTEEVSNRFFGNVNPIGSVVKAENGKLYKVTAVIENVPGNSHLEFDMLCSFSTQYVLMEGENKIDGWGRKYKSFSTYIKITPDFSPEELSADFPNIVNTYLSDNPDVQYMLSLQQIEKIYMDYEVVGGGNKSRVILFSVIGIFVLLIACINYMNLNTADSMKRMKEIGVRKVLGANRIQLTRQLLSESIILSLISLILALTLAEILLPVFNFLLQKNLSFEYLSNWPLSLSFIALAIFTGIFAGLYPAVYLSAIKPVNALKGKFVFGSGHAFFRNTLVVFQFAITIFLISCTGIIYLQIRHTNNADLGFEKDNILTLTLTPKYTGSSLRNTEARGNTLVHIKNELSKLPELSDVSLASSFPFGGLMVDRYIVEDNEESQVLLSYLVDENFTNLLGFKLLKGRSFSDANALEKNNVLITETFAKEMNWSNPIGKTFTPSFDETDVYKVIGVVNDFHQRSFHDKKLYAFIAYSKDLKSLHSIGLKVNSGDIVSARSKIENICAAFAESYDFDITSLTQDVKDNYEEEYRTGKMFTNFAILAIIIAAMGLYGLALFISRQKTKEIGIRKVFGGSVSEIIVILSKNFIKLILIAAFIGIPVAWYYTDIWLQSFVYQTGGRWIVFVLATILAVVIAFSTIFYHSYRAANADPVDTIKYE